MPGCDGTGTAETSHPVSEVRGGGREELPHVRGQGQRSGGGTPRMRPGMAARRSTPMPEARGSGWEDQPTSKEQWLCGPVQEGLMELSHVEGQEGQQ